MAGQSITELRGLLSAKGLAPRKRFGQNFLIDLNLMRKLIAAADVRPGDRVLEVGPGTGSLTELLLEAGAAVVAVEIDRGLAEIIAERLAGRPRLTLIQGDALAGKHDLNPRLVAALRAGGHGAAPHPAPAEPRPAHTEPAEHPPQALQPTSAGPKLVANLPYQIATPLLMELLQFEPRFVLMAFTIQKEVAQRLMAAAGDEAYGPISVVAQSLATLERIATLGPGAFWPRPQVESAMLLMRPLAPDQAAIENVAGFVRLVREAFQHRRQMLRKIVSRWPDGDAVLSALSDCRIDPRLRPQDLSPSEWRRLHARLSPRTMRA